MLRGENMIIELSQLFDDLEERYFEITGQVDQSEMEVTDRDIEFHEPIRYKADFFVLDDGSVEINLKVDYTYTEPCSKCLTATKNSKTTTLSGKLVEGREEDFIDDEYDENYILYENDKLDLGKYIKTQVYVSLPMKTICQKDCKGLCSTCGMNLNENTCDCVEHTIDPRLADLQKFFPKE